MEVEKVNSKKLRMRILLFVLALAVGMAVLPACNQANSSTEVAEESKITPLNVKVRPVVTSSLTENIVFRGTTLPDKNITFSAETSGRVEVMPYDLGARVKRGALLARIDYATLKSQRNRDQVSYDLARKTRERLTSLLADELASRQQMDEAESREQMAKAALDMSEVLVSKSLIHATTAGIVARKLAEVGEYVNPGQPLLQVVAFETVVVSCQVPESLVPRIKRGMPVQVTIDSLQKSFDGLVHVVIPSAHPTSKTFEMRVKVANPDYQILIGMAATVRSQAQVHENVIVIPQDIVVESGSQRFVFVEEGGRARQRQVQLGPVEADRVMIRQGLQAGDRLVIEGHRDLYEGRPIHVVPDQDKDGDNPRT